MAQQGQGKANGAAASGKRRMTVHLGVQKTGSTSIQRFLHRNAEALADTLVLRTPEPDTPMRPLGRAAVTYSLRPGPDSETALTLAFIDVLETLPANAVPVLISHENLAGAMPGNGGEMRLYPALPAIATTLLKAAKGFDVDFVVYTRKMATWKPSVWAQAVRTDGFTGTEDEFMQQTADLPGWGDLIRRISEAVGTKRVTRMNLEDDPDRDRPGRQLLNHVGISDDRIATLEPLDGPSNGRLSPGATEFLRRMNRLQLNPYARGKVVDLVARAQDLFTAEGPSQGTS